MDTTLSRLQRLADNLSIDQDGHVRRSIQDLHATFTARGEIEPAVARMRATVRRIRRATSDRVLAEVPSAGTGLEDFLRVVDLELVPDLRRLGFEV